MVLYDLVEILKLNSKPIMNGRGYGVRNGRGESKSVRWVGQMGRWVRWVGMSGGQVLKVGQESRSHRYVK